MITPYENKVMTSFMLYLDNKVSSNLQAYTNYGSHFFSTTRQYSNVYSYSAPYKQLVSDESVSGATVMSGVKLDGNFIVPGQSGLHSIDHRRGIVYFTGQITGQNRISGDYSVKDLNVFITSIDEETVLFDTKFETKPPTPQVVTGLGPEEQTYPALFIRGISTRNEPAGFGGLDQTIINTRVIVLANSAFQLDAVCSYLRDLNKTLVPPVSDKLPFNAYGAYTGKAYNYTGIASPLAANNSGIFINSVYVNKNASLKRGAGYSDLPVEVYSAFVDYELAEFRKPRTDVEN